jgi:hypothetical protein
MMTGRARTGILPGAALPAAPVPRHRFLGRAGQVIVWLVLLGSPPQWRTCCWG